MTVEAQVSQRFEIHCGIVLRRRFRLALQEIAWKDASIKLHWDENKSWLGSVFFITIAGSESSVSHFEKWLSGIVKLMEEEE